MAVDRLDLSALTLYRKIRCRLLQVSDPGVEMFVRDTALLRLVFGHDAKVVGSLTDSQYSFGPSNA